MIADQDGAAGGVVITKEQDGALRKHSITTKGTMFIAES